VRRTCLEQRCSVDAAAPAHWINSGQGTIVDLTASIAIASANACDANLG
jgi:hypothetical protein